MSDEIELDGPGWAVFGGCEGEMPYLMAFVLGGLHSRDKAQSLCTGPGETVCPAVATDYGVLYTANDYREPESIQELAERFGFTATDWTGESSEQKPPGYFDPATARCDEEVYRQGDPVAIAVGRAVVVEAWVVELRAASGQRVDWHYIGGRARVLALGDVEAVRRAVRERLTTFPGEIVQEINADGEIVPRALSTVPDGTIKQP